MKENSLDGTVLAKPMLIMESAKELKVITEKGTSIFKQDNRFVTNIHDKQDMGTLSPQQRLIIKCFEEESYPSALCLQLLSSNQNFAILYSFATFE